MAAAASQSSRQAASSSRQTSTQTGSLQDLSEILGKLRAKTGMRSLWLKQPQKQPEAGPFSIRMHSFPFQTCPANGLDLLSHLAGLFSKIERRMPGALRQRVRRVAPA
jgi:hypothetical protein